MDLNIYSNFLLHTFIYSKCSFFFLLRIVETQSTKWNLFSRKIIKNMGSISDMQKVLEISTLILTKKAAQQTERS